MEKTAEWQKTLPRNRVKKKKKNRSTQTSSTKQTLIAAGMIFKRTMENQIPTLKMDITSLHAINVKRVYKKKSLPSLSLGMDIGSRH